MNETLTVADVARLLHHHAPESPAAARKVRDLVSRGLPCVPGVRPPVFVRDQVLEWMRDQAAPRPVEPKRKLARGGVRPTPPGGSALDAEIKRLRGG